MVDSRPDPPGNLPDDLVERLEDSPADQLRSVARYAEQLAEHRGGNRRLQGGVDVESDTEGATGTDETEETPGTTGTDDSPDHGRGQPEGCPDDGAIDVPEDEMINVPDDVPGKATLTVKEINDNRYYYWQWREGDEVKSKYERPVDSGE